MYKHAALIGTVLIELFDSHDRLVSKANMITMLTALVLEFRHERRCTVVCELCVSNHGGQRGRAAAKVRVRRKLIVSTESSMLV